VRVEKRIALPETGNAFTCTITVENAAERPLETRFGVEWNFSMLAGDSPDHRYVIDGVGDADSHFASTGEVAGAVAAELHDRHRKFQVALSWTEPAALWRHPVETVSLSEGGFERIYQSSAVMPVWALRLEPGERFETRLQLEVNAL
jgi:alpha-amylase